VLCSKPKTRRKSHYPWIKDGGQVIAKDVSNGDAIWISEVWDSRANHEASLSLPSVKDAIAKNLPLIAGMGDSTITIAVGGHGLSSSKYR
jgi:hypothetical protein